MTKVLQFVDTIMTNSQTTGIKKRTTPEPYNSRGNAFSSKALHHRIRYEYVSSLDLF